MTAFLRTGGRLIGALLLVLMSIPTIAAAAFTAQDNGLIDDTTYQSPQFGYSVTWTDDWQPRSREVESEAGEFDNLTLRSDLGMLWITGRDADDITAAEAVEDRIDEEGNEDDVTEIDLEADIPTAEMEVGRDLVLIEADVLEENGAVVVITLAAQENNFEEALEAVQDQIEFNGDQVLTGKDLAEGEGDVATGEEGESGVGDGTYTGPIYGYSMEFDEDIWAVDKEFNNEAGDGVVLVSDIGGVTFWTFEGYGDDPAACVDGEDEYFKTEGEGVSNWQEVEDENGDPLRYEGDTSAWGVFSLTLTTSSGDEVDLIDYIECQVLPDEDVVLIIMATSLPENYNDHVSAVFDIADTLEFADGSERELEIGDISPEEADVTGTSTQGPDEDEDTDTENDDPDAETGFSGSQFTSPAYGYQFEVPLEWDIVNEELDDTEEIIELTNGTSMVTIWATDDPGALDGLEECVDWVGEESGHDVEVDTDSNGDEFRGTIRREAFANFVYENEDGDQQMYFVSCRWIEKDESVLIIIHDVPYDQFTSERKFRTDIENSIVLPE